MKYLYCWPGEALVTSADQTPFHDPPGNSFASGVAVVDQPLNSPGTKTLVALGAQTRNVTPVPETS